MDIKNLERNTKEIYMINLPMGETYWNGRYADESTQWDLGTISPPLKAYANQLTNKHSPILIPGCGNSYEAEYLIQQGFTNITVIDIAPLAVKSLKKKFEGNVNIHIVLGDFFEHEGQYDLIIEQTFFCALPPLFRNDYVAKMKTLLTQNGNLAGVLFDRRFEADGPPFGGSRDEYLELFRNDFDVKTFETCYNSFPKRMGAELFINLRKKKS